jgi:hypothetical protein
MPLFTLASWVKGALTKYGAKMISLMLGAAVYFLRVVWGRMRPHAGWAHLRLAVRDPHRLACNPGDRC